MKCRWSCSIFFFFQAEDGIRDTSVTGVQTCASDLFEKSQAGSPAPIPAIFQRPGAHPPSCSAATKREIGRASFRVRVNSIQVGRSIGPDCEELKAEDTIGIGMATSPSRQIAVAAHM